MPHEIAAPRKSNVGTYLRTLADGYYNETRMLALNQYPIR